MKFGVRTALVLSFQASLLIDGAARAQTPTTMRVSLDSSGVEGNAASGSLSGSGTRRISAEGRFVVFESAASNLAVGDTNAFTDIFVRDLQSGTTERVSVATGGAQANLACVYPSISIDGRYVAFFSSASNLVVGDTNTTADVFVRDLWNGTTERVSAPAPGVSGISSSCDSPTISADGRFVAFRSLSTNLVAGDTNGVGDVFVRDRVSGAIERVSVDSTGTQGNSFSSLASISADGRFVAFASNASNLVTGDTNEYSDVFVRDRASSTTERVSLSSAGAQGTFESYSPSISADGRFVAFFSFAANLVAGDTNMSFDIFVRDRLSGTTERVSVDSIGTQGNAGSLAPSISDDGRFVAFESEASNLVAGFVNSGSDVFVHDRQSGLTTLASVDVNGVQVFGESNTPSISAGGRFVVFNSRSDDLVPGDMNGVQDVFMRDRGPLLPEVYCTAGTSSHGCIASIAATDNPSLSIANACHITVASVEGQKSGILFYGINNTGFTPGPWASGSKSLLCVKSPSQRTPLQNSGGTFAACNGSYALDWDAYQAANPFALGNPWSIGDAVYLQAWFRDPPAAKSTNLSNAIKMTYVP